MEITTDRWCLVTAKSDQLIAAVEDECIACELTCLISDYLLYAAVDACLRAQSLREQFDELLDAPASWLPPTPPGDGHYVNRYC